MNIKAAWRALWKGCYSWEEPKITCEPRPVFEKPKVVKEYIYIPVSGPIEFFYAATDPAAGYGSSGSTPATWHNKLFISPEAAFAVLMATHISLKSEGSRTRQVKFIFSVT